MTYICNRRSINIITSPEIAGLRNNKNRIIFSIIGESIIIANGTARFANRRIPTRISQMPKSGMKYPLAAIAPKNAAAASGITGAFGIGMNLSAPNAIHARPRMMRTMW